RGVRVLLGGLRELVGVADVVGVGDDLVALVEVAEHDDVVGQPLARGPDPGVELLGRGVAVALREGALARRADRERVGLRGAGTVSERAGVVLPGPLREVGAARAAGGRAGGDAADA